MDKRKIIGLVLLALAVLLLLIAWEIHSKYQNDIEAYHKLQQDFVSTNTTPYTNLIPFETNSNARFVFEKNMIPIDALDELVVDYDRLKEINEDYVGWIHMNSGPSYPIVQGDYTTEYLHLDFEKNYNYSGSIMMSADNDPEFTDRNTVIYGHNMLNGSMFGSNKKYKDLAYAEANPYFWIHVQDGYYVYEIFDTMVIRDMTSVYNTGIAADNEMEQYINEMRVQSLWWRTVGVNEKDNIVSLSTCSGQTGGIIRQVIQGRCLGFVPYF